jgi:hypothetical protein
MEVNERKSGGSTCFETVVAWVTTMALSMLWGVPHHACLCLVFVQHCSHTLYSANLHTDKKGDNKPEYNEEIGS